MGNSSSSACPRMSEMDERSSKEAGGAAATPPSSSGAPCASSFEKTVLLHDWWLIKLKDECSRASLAVGGLATTGKAVRIFNSAPIVKRYDGYTLETADGITVRIQGLINASRMHHNGFPPEACNHFRIGFPYSWKDYADRYFRTDTEGDDVSNCASDNHDHSTDSANTASYDFPVWLKEFPVGGIVDCLNSICKEIVDGAQRRADAMRNLSENNHNNENTNGIVTQAGHNIDGNSNGTEESVYIANLPKNDALGMNSLLDGLKKSNNYVSDDSSLCGCMNVSSPLEKVNGFQLESLATVVTGPDIEKQRVGHISSDPDDMNGNMCCINAIPASDFGPKVLLNERLPENGEESESVATRADLLTKEAERVVCLSESTFLSHELNVEVMNSPGMQSQMVLVNPVSFDAVCIAKRTRNSLKKGYVKSSSLSVSQNCAGMNHNQGESEVINHLDGANIGFTRISKEPLCTETNEMHLEVTGTMGNHSHTALKNILSHKGHRFDEKIVGSVASMMVASKETPKKQVAMADEGMHEQTSVDSYMKDARGKLTCYLTSETKKPPSSVFEKDVNQPQENGKLSLIPSNGMDFGSERVLVECSYNETSDLLPESSGKMASGACDSVKSPSNIINNLEESSIDSPHVAMTMSEPPNKQFSLRRSERLLKLKNSVEDKQRFLEHNKRSIHKSGSKSMSYGTQNGKSSTLNINKGTCMTEGSHPKSADVHAVVARKLNFSSHKSLHDCVTTTIEGILHIGLERNNISSKKQDGKEIQENVLKSQARYWGHSQKKSKNSRKENQSVADTGKNQVLLFSDDQCFMNSENVVTDSHDLTEDRIETDKQNPDMPTMEQSISDIGNNCVVGYDKEAHQSDVPLGIHPNDDKSSGRPAKKSIKKPHFAPQIVKTPLTRQRTKGLSFASPELLNFRRSRSGRLLIPTLANWCQQILYDMDGSVTGIFTGVDAINCDHRGSRSEPPKKKKKVV